VKGLSKGKDKHTSLSILSRSAEEKCFITLKLNESLEMRSHGIPSIVKNVLKWNLI